MAICDECFEDFLHPLVHEAMDKNAAFKTKYGMHARWDWNPDSTIITFSDPDKPTLRIRSTVVGTTQGDQWQWLWSNKNFPENQRRETEKVREFGVTSGYEKLTTAFLDSDEYTGWAMTSIATHILNAFGTYRFPTEHGFCYLVYREILE